MRFALSHPHATRTPPLTIVPNPQPDWGQARSQRLVLRTPRAQWAASATSICSPDGFWAPECLRVDDGATWRSTGEVWRYLHSVSFQLFEGEKLLDLTPENVEASPEHVTYHYTVSSGGKLSVAYTLVRSPLDDSSTLCVNFLPDTPSGDWQVHVKPNLDMRPIEGLADPARHRVNPVDAQHLTVVNRNHWLGFGISRPVEFVPGREQRDVSFLLGTGDRLLRDGEVYFVPAHSRIFSPGIWRASLSAPLRIHVHTGSREDALLSSLDEVAPHLEEWFRLQETRYQNFASGLAVRDPRLHNRIYVMAEKLWVKVGEQLVPDTNPSGIRRPHIRATLEGILHNGQTLLRLNEHERIEQIVRRCAELQDPRTGRFPSHWPEKHASPEGKSKPNPLPAEFYDTGDLGPLLFTVLDEFPLPFAQPDTHSLLWGAFKGMVNGFKAARTTNRLSGPVLLENGLILSVAHDSWMDGKRTVFAERLTITDLPTRCPQTWHVQDAAQFKDSHYTWEQYQYPTFFLPELNALWLRALKFGLTLAKQAEEKDWVEELAQIEKTALSSYKPVFWNSHAQFLYNIVTLDRRVDGTP
ncbi:MAG: hypothetical protein VKN33_06465, partial [Candidatus Sericytochromatia bacterium]|nr:hypothetical protein [Candidatus Sericytochromatia bacterium]